MIGELVLGSIANRTQVLDDLWKLPAAETATDFEVFRLVENAALAGRGVGWVDVHLVASAMLGNARLLTRDKRLAAVAAELGISADL